MREVTVALVDADPINNIAPVGSIPCIVVGRRGSEFDLTTHCDVVVDDDDELDEILTTIERSPQAALAAVLLLRGVENRTIEESLIAESTTYSLLQGGAEFAQWKNHRVSRESKVAGEAEVLSERLDDHLMVTLNSPARRNAFSSNMRTALAEILQVALIDESIQSVTLRGAGSNFSSGGDLDEFGSFTDPISTHISRLTSNVAVSLNMLRERLGTKLCCEMHGENFGAGVELPAFAGWVVANHDTRFCLPEIALGLVPGAGGTASLPRRIGRQRTTWLALTGRAIDAQKAFEWGLIDEIST
jgi:enoyl-CoA hydratase